MNVKQKGSAGEREMCEWLYLHLKLNEKPKRNLEQTRTGGGDIILPPFLFEVKRVQQLSLNSWWGQAVKAADPMCLMPVVAFRQNSNPWNFLISSENLNHSNTEGFVRLTPPVFREWGRSVLAHVFKVKNNPVAVDLSKCS